MKCGVKSYSNRCFLNLKNINGLVFEIYKEFLEFNNKMTARFTNE